MTIDRVAPAGEQDDRGVSALPTSGRVVACYSVLDAFLPACGFDDLTEGMYEGDASRPFEQAQARQAEVLLDRVGCRPGTRLLDVGCGYGRVLRAAQARGARAWGITVSPEQMKRCRRAGLDVRLEDYRRLGSAWDGQFDAVIANGSLEHFVQPADAAAGRDEAIYRHLFATVRRLLSPGGGRFVTTAVHFRGVRPDPRDWLRPPGDFPYGSTEFHWSRLAHSFGGWYPIRGQLEDCAQGSFELAHEEDGTEDYRLTSEACMEAVRARLRLPAGALVWLRSLPTALRRPAHTVRMFQCMLGSESWNWQFRGSPPPTVLLRQTWQVRPVRAGH